MPSERRPSGLKGTVATNRESRTYLNVGSIRWLWLFNTNIVIRARDPKGLAAVRTAVEAMLRQVKARGGR
jgi:hypothetical protein